MDDFTLDHSKSAVDTMDEPDSHEDAVLDDTTEALPFAEARARALAEFDRTFLTAALARHSGNIARTARSLGLHRQSLQKLMARRGIKSGRVPPN